MRVPLATAGRAFPSFAALLFGVALVACWLVLRTARVSVPLALPAALLGATTVTAIGLRMLASMLERAQARVLESERRASVASAAASHASAFLAAAEKK